MNSVTLWVTFVLKKCQETENLRITYAVWQKPPQQKKPCNSKYFVYNIYVPDKNIICTECSRTDCTFCNCYEMDILFMRRYIILKINQLCNCPHVYAARMSTGKPFLLDNIKSCQVVLVTSVLDCIQLLSTIDYGHISDFDRLLDYFY